MARSTNHREFLSRDEQDQVLAAIREAEAACSAEVRLCIEAGLPLGTRDPQTRARQLFGRMGMHHTEQRNGVLFYLAVKQRRFAVLGDENLHTRVGDGFWQAVVGEMTGHFTEDRFGAGLCAGIRQVGRRLAEYYPRQANDANELSDSIAYPE